MAKKIMILTVIGRDRPGIVRELSDVIRENGGNWLESSLSRLGGQFAGVVSVSIAPASQSKLSEKLAHLAEKGVWIEVHQDTCSQALPSLHVLEIEVQANDRPGIIEEISTSLADCQVNVEKIMTLCESASMAGYELFKATLRVTLPDGMTNDHLKSVLECVSDDLVVTVNE